MIGFDIPENEEDEDDGAAAYFQCMKTISKILQILPWNDFLMLVSQQVTDGVSLNTESINGLWARLLREHQIANSSFAPLLLIWCLAHRITIAWKSVRNDNPIIDDLITSAVHLCKFFHNSGKRTAKLRNAAKNANLQNPLKYPSYNSTRLVQYAFNLLNNVLRNWRCSMMYFITSHCYQNVGPNMIDCICSLF